MLKDLKKIKYVICAVIILILSVIYYMTLQNKDASTLVLEESMNSVTTESEEEPSSDSSNTTIYVYICGCINSTGVYEAEEGSRLYEIVEMAGGITQDADTNALNMARVVSDGEKIYVPSIYEEVSSDNNENEADEADGRININTADKSELMNLTGIGEAKAAAIISYRETNGNFKSIEELKNVTGIKDSIYEQIKDSITVD